MIKNSVKRYDRGAISSVERTPQGFLKVPGFATRVGVFPYMDGSGSLRRELRHPDDVFAPESLLTLKNAPVTLEHPPVMVDPSNASEYMVGYTTERVEINRDLVETDLIISDQEGIDAVERDGIRELSSGYVADLVEEEGSYNGIPYNFRQKNIRYNHVALVERGRAGPEVRLRLDSADAMMAEEPPAPEGEEVNTDKVVISGEEVEMPAHLAAVVRDMMDRYDEMRAKLAQLEEGMKKDSSKKDVDVSQPGIGSKVPEEQMAPDGRSAGAKADGEKDEKKEDGEGDEKDEKKKDEEKSDSEKLMDAMAKIDALQAKVDEFTSKSEGEKNDADAKEGKEGKMDSVSVRRRVKLERQAEKLVSAETVAKFDSMSDDQIRAAAIQARHPKADLEGKSTVYLQSRFDSIVETLSEGETTRQAMGSALLRERMDAVESSDPRAARKKMIEESRKLHTSPLSANRK